MRDEQLKPAPGGFDKDHPTPEQQQADVRGRAISTDNSILAYAEDTQGRHLYTIKFKNLTTGNYYEDEIPEVTGNLVWANDNRTVFYTKQDTETLRWNRVYRHVLGTDSDEGARFSRLS